MTKPCLSDDALERAATSCQVLLDQIEVLADIGAFASEFGVPQPLIIHVAADVIAPSRDELSRAFDYNRIHAFAHELARQRITLIETFAQRLARKCLGFDTVLAVEVRIEKPRAIPGCIAGTRVRLNKTSIR